MGVEQQRARYAQAREALWGKPRVINVAAEMRRREAEAQRLIEQSRLGARRKWEREREAKKRAEETSAAALERLKKHGPLGFHVTGTAVAASFDLGSMEPYSVPAPIFHLTMQQIARKVLANHPGVTIDDVKGPSRAVPVMRARRHIIGAIRTLRPDISYPAIGRFVKKDHSSCVHAFQKFTMEMDVFHGFVDDVDNGN
jgi:hypothetical protein